MVRRRSRGHYSHVVGGSGGRGASLKEIAQYLTGLRPILSDALRGRQEWVRRIGVLLEDVRHGNAAVVVQAAGKIGREQIVHFRDNRAQVDRLRPPPGCEQCQAAIVNWLDQLIAVCEVLIAAGQAGDLKRLGETQEMLAESRTFARRFNGEYHRIVTDLRQRVGDAHRERARNERQRAARKVSTHQPMRVARAR